MNHRERLFVGARRLHREYRPAMRAPKKKRASIAGALALTTLVLFALALNSGSQPLPEAVSDPSPGELTDAHAAFDVVYQVLQHPRCLNCHPAGDRPLQYDDRRPHAMNVVRGPDDGGIAGMRCDSCHGKANAAFPNLPPGVSTGWRLAPREMVFEGLTRSKLADQLLDPQRSHLNREEMLEHVAHDPLVLWGWDPGPGREPVSISHVEFVAAFRSWIEAGAPVPPEGTRND